MTGGEVPGWVGKPVIDTYGRRLGRAVGLVFDLRGDVVLVGVEQAGSFRELRADMVVSDFEELRVMPEWKADSKRAGIEGALLERRLTALDEMVEDEEISQESYDALHAKLIEVRATQDEVLQRILIRLDSLEHEDESMSSFVDMIKLEFNAGEMSEESYNLTMVECEEIKVANAREKDEITRTIGDPHLRVVTDIATSKRLRATSEESGMATNGSQSEKKQTSANVTGRVGAAAAVQVETPAELESRAEPSAQPKTDQTTTDGDTGKEPPSAS
jgi:hypothetical protein